MLQNGFAAQALGARLNLELFILLSFLWRKGKSCGRGSGIGGHQGNVQDIGGGWDTGDIAEARTAQRFRPMPDQRCPIPAPAVTRPFRKAA